jgi:hypothetical protein
VVALTKALYPWKVVYGEIGEGRRLGQEWRVDEYCSCMNRGYRSNEGEESRWKKIKEKLYLPL